FTDTRRLHSFPTRRSSDLVQEIGIEFGNSAQDAGAVCQKNKDLQVRRPSLDALFLRLRAIALALWGAPASPKGSGWFTKFLYTTFAQPRSPRSWPASVPARAESHSRMGMPKPVLGRERTAAGSGQSGASSIVALLGG